MASRIPTVPPIGLVVEGESEIAAIPELLKDTGIRFTTPIKFGGQPVQCTAETFRNFIQLKIVPRVYAMTLKGVGLVMVVIDRENRGCCPGEFAQQIAQSIVQSMMTHYSYTGSPPISVVCADRKLENWLIADPNGIATHKYVVKDLSRVVGVKADGKDAVALIKRAFTPGHYYHKQIHAPQLAGRVRSLQRDVRIRSHSLDKLLRECGIAPLA